MKVYDINIVTYHTFCRSAGTSPQPELGPDKYQGSLHSRDGPSHDTILWQENLNLEKIWLIMIKWNEKTLKHFVKCDMLIFRLVR